MNKKRSLMILLFLSFPFMTLFAENYKFVSDSLSTIITEGRKQARLSGHVRIESERRLIEADMIEMSGDNYRYFTGRGAVLIRDKEKNILLRADSFFFDKEADIMRLSGRVIMEDYDNEVVVKCQYLERIGKEEKIILQVGVRILKDDIVCRSEFAVYYRDTERLELTGLPVVYKKEDLYRADRILVNLDNEEITMEGDVSGSLKTGDEDETKPLDTTDSGQTEKAPDPSEPPPPAEP
jgi:lipopolysaccharide export system protein LptA